jgi:hypothetical protein
MEGKIEFVFHDATLMSIASMDENADIEEYECVMTGLEARGLKVGFFGTE